jgi:GT2 family glycosyltransferase
MHHEPTLDVVATYSAAFRRTVFADVKGFDPAFPKANNEDVELSYRLSELGHRMIFVPAAVVYHPHGATWWDYAQTKLGRAYWRTIVYKRYPVKAIKDSYTPQILKVQILLAPLCLVGLLWFFLTQEARALLLFVPFLLTTLPMIRFAWQQREVRVAFWTPWGLWIRSLVFALGVVAGLLFGNRTEQAVESVLQK